MQPPPDATEKPKKIPLKKPGRGHGAGRGRGARGRGAGQTAEQSATGEQSEQGKKRTTGAKDKKEVMERLRKLQKLGHGAPVPDPSGEGEEESLPTGHAD